MLLMDLLLVMSRLMKMMENLVHDDPKLINKSIKKQRKQQQKSVQKWKDRDETKNKARAEKQKARNDNIQGRIQAKKAKKIEKREKKLMRPGFEGVGFVCEMMGLYWVAAEVNCAGKNSV
ncbi:hypothetical protein C5167_013138 [Papaver somniferum]|uniref:Ribosomal RNA-processing protein 14/surfeit locus protein 6 C-terminal domain-containing protein n=1 Tax=Papaver somniferum TaxID=3469 RepID=A0A4Y7IZF8_PAPSO|nr:hypothetical protein C5167_013138 [Papaver somniferum]